MLVLHHLEYSQSFRVLWLLEELGLDYELKIYERDKATNLAPADYKAISPLGTSPVITDGDQTLAETGAIFDYIIDQYPDSPLRPDVSSAHRADYLFWLHAAQGSLMPMMLMDTVFLVLKKRVPFLIRPLISAVLDQADKAMMAPRLKAIFAKAEQDLQASGWFAGSSLSAADMMLSYPLEAAQARGMLKKYPNCERWVENIRAIGSYQSAREKDGRPSTIFSVN
jgi:glutathione S-transferase